MPCPERTDLDKKYPKRGFEAQHIHARMRSLVTTKYCMFKRIRQNQSVILYKRLMRFVFKYWAAFLFAILGNIGYSSVTAYTTYLFKPILDKGFIAHNMKFLHLLPFVVIAVFFSAGLMNVMASYFMGRVANGVVMDFRQKLFEKYMQLPARFYDNSSSGQLISVILFNVAQVSNAGSDAVTTIVQSLSSVIGLLVVMFTISWKLSLVFITVLPVVMVTMQKSSKRLRRINMELQEQMGDVTSIAEEGIEGYKVVRAYGGQQYEMKKFNKATYRNFTRQMKMTLTSCLTVSGIQFIVAAILAVIIFLATSPHSVLALTAGGFVAMLAAMLALLKPLKNFTKANSRIQRGLAGAASVFEVLDFESEQDEGTIAVKKAKGEIVFDDVSFAYPTSKRNVLQHISFHAKAGKTIAFVGHSGSGKSTIINILQRFYVGWSGQILLDNTPIENYMLSDLRQQFATVSQQVTLFNDTIAHNIAYGKFSEASEEEIVAAAKAANAWEFIKEMPEGLNTLIGENGVLLSGGQRQRLAIARAILKDTPILILDEATSALDTESERLIQDALDRFMRQRTTLVIAHRLSTIENADLIVVLEQGKLVETGQHQALLAQNGIYAKLYKMQFREEGSGK